MKKSKRGLFYNVEEEQRILRVASGGQCQCDYDWIHGYEGLDRCPNRHGQASVPPKKGHVILTVRFFAKEFDYTKAKAYCYHCNMAYDKLVGRNRAQRKPRKPKPIPGQVGMFDQAGEVDGLLVLIVALIFAIIVLFSFALFISPPIVCKSKAQKMSVNYDYGFVQGCMIEAKPGVWVDIENYRVAE